MGNVKVKALQDFYGDIDEKMKRVGDQWTVTEARSKELAKLKLAKVLNDTEEPVKKEEKLVPVEDKEEKQAGRTTK